MKLYKGLYFHESYNVGFMGCQREQSTIDGHYYIVTDFKEFVIQKFGTYANFTSITHDVQSLVLTPGDIRFVNDYILKEMDKYDVSNATDIADAMWDNVYGDTRKLIENLWANEKHHPFVNKRISANIQWGDTVTNLEDGETFTVNSDHDLPYINRNHYYKLVDRDMHPKEMTKKEFLVKFAKVNPWSDFSNWETDKPLPKKPYHLKTLTIDGEVYACYIDYDKDIYYIVHNETVYSYASNISRPFYDCVDKLTGFVFHKYVDGSPYHYCLKKVSSSDVSDHFKVFNEPVSYRYNTRATYI